MYKTNKTISIHIVSWNSLSVLPHCLESILSQSFQDYSIILVDNASQDQTLVWIEKKYPFIHIIRNSRNQGFSYAHNQAIRASDSPFILVVNPDVIMAPDYLEKTFSFIQKNPNIASIGGKLIRDQKSRVLDSAGLVIHSNRKVSERGAGEIDQGQYDQSESVFGVSGALALYRRKSLEQTKLGEDYFDSFFFAYKEDIDLAWRLRHDGWDNWYLPTAEALHPRTVKELGSGTSWKQRVFNRNQRGKRINSLSYRNHLCLLIKNQDTESFKKNFLKILWYEFAKFCYLLLYHPKSLKSLLEIYRKRKDLLEKRKQILQNSDFDLTPWIIKS